MPDTARYWRYRDKKEHRPFPHGAKWKKLAALLCWVWDRCGAGEQKLDLGGHTCSKRIQITANWKSGHLPSRESCTAGRHAEPVQPLMLTFWHKIQSCHLPSASAVVPGAFQTLLQASASPEWRSEGHRVSRTNLLKCLIHYWQDKNEKTRVTHWPRVLKKLTQRHLGTWRLKANSGFNIQNDACWRWRWGQSPPADFEFYHTWASRLCSANYSRSGRSLRKVLPHNDQENNVW